MRLFLNFSPEKFGGSCVNCYLCIRFRVEARRRDKKSFFERITWKDSEVVQEATAPLGSAVIGLLDRRGRGWKDTSRSIHFERCTLNRRSVLGQEILPPFGEMEIHIFTMESLILAQDER